MIFDIVVIAALLISAIIAFLRGFIREVLTILGVVGGAFVAIALGPTMAPVVAGWLGVDENAEDPQKLFDIIPFTLLADILAYAGIFIIVVIILSIVSHFLSNAVKAIGLGAVDRSFGVVFGIVRAVILLGLLYLPLYILVDKSERTDWFEGSRSHVYVEMTAGWMAGMLPESVSEDVSQKSEDAAEAMVRNAREKLEDIDVLKVKDPVPADKAQEEQTDSQNGADYDKEQRRNLQDLIGETLNDQ